MMTGPTLSAWNEGVSLWNAVEKYSNEQLWNEYIILDDDLFSPRENYPDPVNNFQELAQKHTIIGNQLTSEILTLLKTGLLLAVAYRSPRLRHQDPVLIDSDSWRRGKVNWERSELWIDGNRFEEVRVLRPPASKTAEAIAAISPAEPQRSPGRPSRAKEIKAAYTEVRDAGKIDFALSLNANLPTIQQGVHALSGNLSNEGLKYEAIRHAVGKQFRRDKAAPKGSR
jgi:hypothetical protein